MSTWKWCISEMLEIAKASVLRRCDCMIRGSVRGRDILKHHVPCTQGYSLSEQYCMYFVVYKIDSWPITPQSYLRN